LSLLLVIMGGQHDGLLPPFWQPAYLLHLYSHYILFMANKLCCCYYY